MLRRLLWRLGRRLYMQARGEGPNDMRTNGETWLQGQVVALAKASSASVVVLDIGANVGEWTESLVDQARILGLPAGQLHVHAFEPVPGTRRLLEERIARLHLDSAVSVWPTALSNRCGSAAMNVLAEGAGTNSLEGGSPSGDRIEVPLQTLDRFCEAEAVERIAMVKCDAEGHDLFILEGARHMLDKGRIDLFQFEYNSRWILSSTNLKRVFDLVSSLEARYVLGRLCPSRIELFEGWHPELDRFFETNMVLVRGDLVPALGCYRGRFDQANTYA